MFTLCDNFEDGNHTRIVSQIDLLLFLCKVRQGLSDTFLKLTSKEAVSSAVSKVRIFK